MKPIRLIIEGFTCFKDEQPPLDFTGLDLFAITGPTGAGKTSILDAVIFALYGKVPRVGKSYGELIALGRDRMSIVLDFEVGPRRFRVARTGRRGRSGEALLEEISEDKAEPITSKVHQVDSEIVELLGLRYEAFTQAVVLPQGEFARFLHSQPRDRREIIRDLLRLQVYEQMRKAAFERAKERNAHLRAIEERLEQDYKDATASRLEELKSRSDILEEETRKTAAQMSEEQEKVERVKLLHGKTQELHRNRLEREKLGEKEPLIEAADEKLQTARRVTPLIPLFDAVDESERRVEVEGARLESTEIALVEATKVLDEARTLLEAARRAAGKVPDLRDRLRALDEIKGLLEPKEAAKKRLRETKERLEALENEECETDKGLAKAREDVERLEAKRREASARVKKVRYDPAQDRLLDEVRDEAVQLGSLRQEASRVVGEIERAKKEVAAKNSEVSRCQAASDEARQQYENERQNTETAQEALQEAERDYSAAHLRDHLAVGKKCPVCGSRVNKLPPPLQITFVEALGSQVEEARKAEEASRRILEEKDRWTAKALSDRETVERAVEELKEKGSIASAKVEQLGTTLATKMKSVLRDEPGKSIEDLILSRSKQSNEQRARYAKAAESEQAILTELAEVSSGLDQLQGEFGFQSKRRQELEEQSKAAEEELTLYEEKIARITAAPDPVVEAEQLLLEVQKLEEALRAAEQTERSRFSETVSKERAVEEVRRVSGEVAARARQKRDRLSDALKEAGFASEEAARRMVVTEDERDRLERDVSEFRRERHATQKRIEELEKELGPEEVTDEDLSLAIEQVSRLRKDYEESLEEKAALGQQLKDLAGKLKKADELTRERERLSADHSIYRRLADDLRSENFQAYLLEEAFRELVEGASERLRKLSGRYAMEYHADTFHVLDHDNAGERRSADTLSGGETFLASLALALELSEQVQRAAGAVHLDSLFIDEGFGTLDLETLDTVTSAIESLPVGGRMVGIITHIPELTERLPDCIRVEKTADGSRVVQDRVV